MNNTKEIISIVVTYSNGDTEQFSSELNEKITLYQGDHNTVAGFITELLHEWDKDYALQELQNHHEIEFKEQLISYQEKLQQQKNTMQESHEHGLISQRGQVAGKILERFLPIFSDYEYNPDDVIPIFNTFDFLVLKGRCQNNITSVIFQEVKTGNSRMERLQKNLRDIIVKGHVSFEQWKYSDKQNKFHKINYQ